MPKPLKFTLILFASLLMFKSNTRAQINTQVTDSIKAVLESSKVVDSLYIRTLLNLTGEVRFYDLDEALIHARRAEQLSKDLNIRTELASSYYYISVIYHLKGFSNLSTEYAKICAETFEGIPDLFRASFAYNLLGIIYTEKRQDDEAIRYLSKSLEVSESLNDTLGIIQVLNNIGTLYINRNESGLAKAYFERAVKHIEANGFASNYGECYVNLASQEDDKTLREKYLGKAELAFAEINYVEGIGKITLVRASNAFQDKSFQKSINLYKEAIAHFRKHDLRYEVANAQILLANTYKDVGYLNQAESLISECLKFALELNSTEVLAKAYELQTEIQEKLGRPVLALESYKALKTLNDSIDNIEKANILAENEAKYRTQEKVRELELKEQELLIQKSRNSNIIIWSLLTLLALGSISSFYFYRQKKRSLEDQSNLLIKDLEAKNLKEKEQLKSAFFANISHEFRTPLTLIISPLKEVIRGSFKGNINTLNQSILKNGERLLDLVNQLLDLSKLEMGHLELKGNDFDIISYLKGLAGTFESMAEVREIEFSLTAPKGEVLVHFEKDKMHKIVSNLLSNAFKFTPDFGKVTMEILVNKNHLEIHIKDSGIGIEEETLPYIFERFYQSNNFSEIASTGIGLALTKELVELHRGSIEVKSILNEGSIFIISLPIIENHSGSIESRLISEPSLNPNIVNSTYSKMDGLPLLLIVEDNKDVAKLIFDTLNNSYNIVLAENGKNGLDIANELIPDVVITDVMMPKMNGYEFCEQLKTGPTTSHIPIIMLTALSEQKDKMEGLEKGADAYLSKPFEIGELKIRLAKLIELREQLKQNYSKSINLRPEEIKVSSVDQQFMFRVNEVLESNLNNESFSISDFANEMALSKKQLNRKFKAILNQTANEIIRNYRLEKAYQLLVAKAINPTEASYQFGFGSPAYFSKCFSDRYGYPPSRLPEGTMS